MKYLLLSLVLITSACAQLMKGAEQPVTQYRDVNTFRTTCSGVAEDWGSCARKARRTCPNGYQIEDKFQDSNGAIRSMIFSCKK